MTMGRHPIFNRIMTDHHDRLGFVGCSAAGHGSCPAAPAHAFTGYFWLSDPQPDRPARRTFLAVEFLWSQIDAVETKRLDECSTQRSFSLRHCLIVNILASRNPEPAPKKPKVATCPNELRSLAPESKTPSYVRAGIQRSERSRKPIG